MGKRGTRGSLEAVANVLCHLRDYAARSAQVTARGLALAEKRDHAAVLDAEDANRNARAVGSKRHRRDVVVIIHLTIDDILEPLILCQRSSDPMGTWPRFTTGGVEAQEARNSGRSTRRRRENRMGILLIQGV